jgi:hypothetical protein
MIVIGTCERSHDMMSEFGFTVKRRAGEDTMSRKRSAVLTAVLTAVLAL